MTKKLGDKYYKKKGTIKVCTQLVIKMKVNIIVNLTVINELTCTLI